MSLTFDALREANISRCGGIFHPIDEWSPTDWATAMAGECGEACNYVKKLRRLQTNGGANVWKRNQQNLDEDYLKEQIGIELADLIIYVDLLAARIGVNLSEAVRNKFNKVSKEGNSKVRL